MNSPDTIWHPFTQMMTAEPPIHVAKAKGSILYGSDGKEYIDAISSWWVNIHGHCNEQIAASIATQASILEHVLFAGFTHSPAIELSKKLISVLPGNFAKVFFSDDGSTSVEVALKMAIQYWHNQGKRNRTFIIALQNAYHGDTFGAMSIAERNIFNAAFSPFLFDVHRLPLPDAANIENAKTLLWQWAEMGDVAAFIFEPLVQGAAGMLMYEAEYLDELVGLAKELGIICIADEVMTGFGRTGKNFAIDYLDHQPDIICLSKGITGGFLPLGATVCTQQIFDAFYSTDRTKTFFHGHSYTANPLACAAACASMDLLSTSGCKKQIADISSSHTAFAEEIKGHGFVKEVRQQGTILALELGREAGSSYFSQIRDKAYGYYLSRGVFLRPLGNTVYIMPPYCVTTQELGRIYAAVRDSLQFLSLS